ncbi:MAG: alpha/beta hydrolase family protein, partial [Cyanobium sp.]
MAAPAKRQPLAASRVVGAIPAWSEPRLRGGRLFWLERRPAEGGRSALLCRPLDDLNGPAPTPLEISPSGADLRSRTHDYGGGVYALAEDGAGGTMVVWVNDRDRALWSLALPPLAPSGSGEVDAPGALAQRASAGSASDPGSAEAPRRLTSADPARRFADGLIDAPRQRWIGVLEEGEAEALVAVPLAGGEPQPLRQAADFIGYAALSPSSSHLAWVEWQRPWMPWERSELWLGRIGAAGELLEARRIAGSGAGDREGISIFQPLWIPRAEGPADLVVANDRSGWWNLECLRGAEALTAAEEPRWQALLPQPAEFALPQWVYGMRSTAWDGEALVAMACRDGRWELGRLSLPERLPALAELPQPPSPQTQHFSEGQHKGQSEARGEGQRKRQREIEGEGEAGLAPAAGPHWCPLDLPFDDLAAVAAEAGRVVALAASATEPSGLLERDSATGRWRHTPASPGPLPIEAISTPEAIAFAGHGGITSQAWYYPPAGGGGPRSPLLVRAHSGPTGMARTGVSLAIQFWTSRGWGVVDVNYGGSTGFGRAYRQRLDGRWGVVDVADCAAAASCLVESGRADRRRI